MMKAFQSRSKPTASNYPMAPLSRGLSTVAAKPESKASTPALARSLSRIATPRIGSAPEAMRRLFL